MGDAIQSQVFAKSSSFYICKKRMPSSGLIRASVGPGTRQLLLVDGKLSEEAWF